MKRLNKDIIISFWVFGIMAVLTIIAVHYSYTHNFGYSIRTTTRWKTDKRDYFYSYTDFQGNHGQAFICTNNQGHLSCSTGTRVVVVQEYHLN